APAETPQLLEQADPTPIGPTMLDPLKVARYAMIMKWNSTVMNNIGEPILRMASATNNNQSAASSATMQNPQLAELKQIIAQREEKRLEETKQDEQKKLLQQMEKTRAEAEERARLEGIKNQILNSTREHQKLTEANDLEIIEKIKIIDDEDTKAMLDMIDNTKTGLN